MRLLFVNTVKEGVWGGVESWMLRVGSFLRRRGHTVAFAGKRGGIFLNRLSAEGFTTVSISPRCDVSPASIAKLALHIKRQRFDAIVVNTNRDLRIGGIAARLVKPRPVVINRRGLPAFRRRLRHRLSAALADLFLVPSLDLKRALLGFGWIDEERIAVIPNFVSVSEVRSLAQQPPPIELGDDAPIIGTVANLVGQKDIPTLLRALAALAEDGVDFRAVVVGEGPLRKTLQCLAHSLGLDEKITWTGFLENSFPLVRRFDIFVLTSRFEPFGQVLVEAAALGVPIVASAVGGVPEVVEDGRNGILVAPGKPKAFAEAIKRLIEDPDLRRSMGEAGLRVSAKFDEAQIAPKLEKFFEEAVSGRWSGR